MSKNAVSYRKKMQKLVDKLSKSCNFDKIEIEAFCQRYENYLEQVPETERKKWIDRTMFRFILHTDFDITDDVIMDRIFKAFDTDNDGKISHEKWVRGMSTFLKGSLAERVKFCFLVYDMNGDGYITRDDMFHCLKSCLQNLHSIQDEDPDDGIRDIVDLCLKQLDKDNDHRVSIQDFEKAVGEESLLLEILGTCLPSERVINSYLVGCKEMYPK